MKAAAPPRTVLMVSYAFPPEAYVGGRRTLKYCKYLGQFGWRPIVITIKPRSDAFQDERLTEQLPDDVTVLRTRDWDAAALVEKVSRWKQRLAMAQPLQPGASDAQTVAHNQQRETRASWFSRAKQLIQHLLLESPDSHIWWVPLAIMRGARVLLTERVDVIYSSSPPHSSHLAAYVLAKCFRKPHVVDFRDPWVTGTGVLQRWQAYAKRQVMTNAARLVVVSPGEPDDLRAELPQLDAGRMAVLTNGYDPDDFGTGTSAPRDPRHFTITHAGTLYRETGQELFHALEQVIEADPGLRHVLRVNLIGEVDSEHQDMVRRLEAAGVVRSLRTAASPGDDRRDPGERRAAHPAARRNVGGVTYSCEGLRISLCREADPGHRGAGCAGRAADGERPRRHRCAARRQRTRTQALAGG